MPQVLYSPVFSAHGEPRQWQFTLTKNVSYIFLRPPSFLAVQGVGMPKLSIGLIRAAKFTKNTNDQWNHAGGFATTISTSLSLKYKLKDVNSKRLTDLWCPVRGLRTPPNADGCTAVAFWRLGFGKVKALFSQAKASTSLGSGPLKLGRLIANGSQAVPLFEPRDSFTNSYS